LEAKQKTVDYNWNTALQLLATNNKLHAQAAYKHLQKVKFYAPNTDRLQQAMNEAREKGTFNFMVVVNGSNGYQRQLLMNKWRDAIQSQYRNEWSVFHFDNNYNTNYDATVAIQYDAILFSPERERRNQYTDTKKVEDGYEWIFDKKNILKDTTKLAIKQIKYKIITAQVFKTELNKEVEVVGSMSIIKRDGQTIHYPLQYHFTWFNESASYKGDKRALTADSKQLLCKQYQYFPNNDWMLEQANTAWVGMGSTHIQSVY
jgi:hypothetical protein